MLPKKQIEGIRMKMVGRRQTLRKLYFFCNSYTMQEKATAEGISIFNARVPWHSRFELLHIV